MGLSQSVVSKFVFMPPEPCTYTLDRPSKVIFVTTKSGKQIPAYFLPANPKTKTTILYSHGNAADLGAMYEFLVLLRNALGVNVFHYDYIGYGLAKEQGTPNETNTYESADAAFTYLTKERGYQQEDIIVFGTSVGSGPTCYLAQKHKLKGVVLECPFTSIIRVVSQSMFGRLVDMFQNINKLPKVKCPVYIMHGTKDDIIPVEHGKELYSVVPNEFKFDPVWVQGANHHDIMEKMTLRTYIKKLQDFIEYCDNFQKKQRYKEDKSKEIIINHAPVKIDENAPTTEIRVRLTTGQIGRAHV